MHGFAFGRKTGCLDDRVMLTHTYLIHNMYSVKNIIGFRPELEVHSFLRPQIIWITSKERMQCVPYIEAVLKL